MQSNIATVNAELKSFVSVARDATALPRFPGLARVPAGYHFALGLLVSVVGTLGAAGALALLFSVS